MPPSRPKPALLEATERAGRVEAVVGVGPHHPGLQVRRHPEDLGPLVGPHAGREPVARVVGLGHRLLGGAEREHREDRAEDLLAGDAVRLGHAGEDRRREPVAACGQLARRLVELPALVHPRGDQLRDLVELRPGVDRAEVGVLVQRVADAQRRQPVLQLLQQQRGDGLLHEQARAGTAHVALVEVDAVDDRLRPPGRGRRPRTRCWPPCRRARGSAPCRCRRWTAGSACRPRSSR